MPVRSDALWIQAFTRTSPDGLYELLTGLEGRMPGNDAWIIHEFIDRRHHGLVLEEIGRTLARRHELPRAGMVGIDHGPRPDKRRALTGSALMEKSAGEPDSAARRLGDIAGYHPVRREFSGTEDSSRGTCGHLVPGGRDQRGFVTEHHGARTWTAAWGSK